MIPRLARGPGVGPAAWALSAASVALDQAGSRLGAVAAAGLDFTRTAADLAHLGSFLAGVAALGVLLVEIHDRAAGRGPPSR